MTNPRVTVKTGTFLALLLAMLSVLTGCATQRVAPVSDIENLAEAVTVPFRISESGRFLIDVSINDAPHRPFSVDTGATVSVVYSDFAEGLDLEVSDTTRFVRGLIGQGDRPVIANVNFQIGTKMFPLNQIVMLETPPIADEAIGLIGGDILRGRTIVFDRETGMATFVPREEVDRRLFSGWKQIPLRTLTDVETLTDLYFAHAEFGGEDVPVLFDTGSNLNFINWKLAKMDESIRRLERQMIRNGTLQGALDSTSATVETVLYDLKLGAQQWDEIPVVVTGLDGLAAIAPVDVPMMVAGASLFTPHTIAFDLEGLRLYVRPDAEP